MLEKYVIIIDKIRKGNNQTVTIADETYNGYSHNL